MKQLRMNPSNIKKLESEDKENEDSSEDEDEEEKPDTLDCGSR